MLPVRPCLFVFFSTQDAKVKVGYYSDSLLYLVGPTVSFDLGTEGVLDVTFTEQVKSRRSCAE
jgi:hypothetical protein